MEFQNQGFTVFFRLDLADAHAGVSIRRLLSDPPIESREEETRRLAAAIADASSPPAEPRSSVRSRAD